MKSDQKKNMNLERESLTEFQFEKWISTEKNWIWNWILNWIWKSKKNMK